MAGTRKHRVLSMSVLSNYKQMHVGLDMYGGTVQGKRRASVLPLFHCKIACSSKFYSCSIHC